MSYNFKSSVFAAPNVLSELCAIDCARNENLLIPNHELSLMPEKHIGAENGRERKKPFRTAQPFVSDLFSACH